jgi:nucleotide-binding universal stress UspA family protein
VQVRGKWLTVNYAGKPGEAIVKISKDEKATLIVIGCRGLGSVRRTLMGSVSDYVVHHAHCPVAVCKKS